MQSSLGYDIVFASDPQGVNKLDYEIDNYNPATGAAGFWVRIPLLSHSADTLIYMFYGNPAVITSQENKTGVWGNSGYSAVYHFPAANLGADSTGTNNGMVGQVTAATGEIGGAASFTGYSGSYINVGNNSSLNATNTVMISAWVYTNSLNYGAIFEKGTAQGNGDYRMEDHSAIWYAQVNNGLWSTGNSTASLTAGTWTRLDMCWDGTRMLQYMNGALNTTTTLGAQTLTPNTQNAAIGYDFISSSGWSGLIDELRVSTAGCHSSDWIATEYNNQSPSSTFYNFVTITSLSPTIGQVGTQVSIQGTGFGTSQGASTVTFNGVNAAVTSWNSTQIIATVPVGAVTGDVVVTVEGATSNVVEFMVGQPGALTTVTSLAASGNPATFGVPITFTATVEPSDATGTIAFMDGSFTLGVVALSSGTTSYSISTLAVGTHSITAVYSGDSNYQASTSNSLTETTTEQTFPCPPQ